MTRSLTTFGLKNALVYESSPELMTYVPTVVGGRNVLLKPDVLHELSPMV